MEAFRAPRLPDPEAALYAGNPKRYLRDLHRSLTAALADLERIAVARDLPAGTAFTTANVTSTTSIDGAASDLATTRNVLATLIDALKARSILRGKA